MATGLPVVVTDAPGNREWVVTSENGWLAAPGDADAFKRAMLDAAEMSHSGRQRIAIANRRLIEQRADWNVNFGKLLAAYDYLEARFRRKDLTKWLVGSSMEATDRHRLTQMETTRVTYLDARPNSCYIAKDYEGY